MLNVEIMKFGKNEYAAVTSLDVAETFGKGHDKVMRDIRELGCSSEFNVANFGEIDYKKASRRCFSSFKKASFLFCGMTLPGCISST